MGGDGGVGIRFAAAATFTNSGTITAGNGGAGAAVFFGGTNGAGGAGGTGLVGSGLTITNSGTITGGNGGAGGQGIGPTGGGGAGIVGSGLTITNSGTISGGLSGNGVMRANAISFTGGTNVLELQAGSSITGNVVAFSAGDTLRLGGAMNSTFDVSQIGGAAQYRGFGLFAKTGSSTWTLTGTNTAALPWSISGGTLAANATMANSTVTVNAGATLAGTGTVGATTIMSGGSLAPGNSPGTITIAGSLAFQSGALYVIQVTPATASSANVSGSATLGGASVQTVFAAGSYLTNQYTILHSGGLAGTFSGVSGNVPAGFTQSLSYTATDVILNLTANLAGPSGPSALPSGGFSSNQQNVANSLNTFFNNGGALPPSFVNVFGLTGNNLGNALTLLSGEAATGAQQGAFQLMSQFLGVMLDPFVDGRSFGGTGPALGFAAERDALPDDVALAYAKVMKAPHYNVQAAPTFEPRWTVWGSAYGGYNKTNGDSAVGSHDFNARAGGIAAGADYRLTRDTVVGFALAGGGTNWSLANGLGGGSSDVFQAGVYGATRWGPAYLAGSLAYAHHWMTTDRFAVFNDHLTAKFDAESFGGRVEGGYRFGMWFGGVTPYAAVQAQGFRTPSYNETDVTGGGFALSYNSRTATDTRSELGSRFDHVAATSSTSILTLRGRLAWAHDWVSDPTRTALFQALPGASFVVNGAAPAKDSALVSAGAELRFANNVALLAKFDGEFASGSQTYAGTGTVRYTW